MSDFTVDEHEDNLKDVAILINEMGYVHRSELRELIEQRRAESESAKTTAENSRETGVGSPRFPEGIETAYSVCADELEALLE